MTRKKLDRIRRELATLRAGSHKARTFQSLAKKLGRKRNTKRGKEPMWESETFPDLFPLAIPDHGHGKDVSPGVQKQLLNLMEEDILRWEQKLDEEEDEKKPEDDEFGDTNEGI